MPAHVRVHAVHSHSCLSRCAVVSVSRSHLRLRVLSGSPLQLRVEQLGKHPTAVFRLADLDAIGWLAPEQGAETAGAAAAGEPASVAPAVRPLLGGTPAQIAARASRALFLSPGQSATLGAGDAFGIQGDSTLWPFWIAGLPPVMTDAHAAGTPPLSLSRDPSHVSCASLSPHSMSRAQSGAGIAAAGPISPFYQSLRTESLRAAFDRAQQLDGGIAVPTAARVSLEQQVAAAEEEEDRRRCEFEASSWSMDLYPDSKRRRIVPVIPGPGEGVLMLPTDTAETGRELPAVTPITLGASTVVPSLKSARSPSPASAAASAPALPASSHIGLVSPSPPASPAAPAPPSPTLVLPSLSTGDFQFQAEKACPIAERSLRSFLRSYSHVSDLRIILLLPCDPSGAPTAASREVQAYFAAHPMDGRFSVRVGDMSALGELGLSASCLVHPSTYRFQGGEGGVLNRLLPGDFATRMHKQYGAASAGKVFPSRVEPGGALQRRCPGLQWLLTVRPPCMNEARPDCLHGDYMRGCKELRNSYDAVLTSFAELAKLERNLEVQEELVSSPPEAAAAAAASETASIYAAASHSSAAAAARSSTPSPSPIATAAPAVAPPAPASASPSSPSFTVGTVTFVSPPTAPTYRPPSTLPPKTGGHFSTALYYYVKQPRLAALQPYVFWEDADVTVIYDVYPKARVHLLLLPRRKQITQVADLTVSDFPLLYALEARARWIASILPLRDPAGRVVPLRAGFHAEPSMRLLHLHLLSADLTSPALKNKKHWNSFASRFFIRPTQMRELVTRSAEGGEAEGSADAAAAAGAAPTSGFGPPRNPPLAALLHPYAKLLNGPLLCHRQGCGLRCNTLPELKHHLTLCLKPYPT